MLNLILPVTINITMKQCQRGGWLNGWFWAALPTDLVLLLES